MMPIKISPINYDPLLREMEITVVDGDLLADYVAHIAMGYSFHIRKILLKKHAASIIYKDHMIDNAIQTLTVLKGNDPWRRDGWVFQIISWISIYLEYSKETILTQQPHDAPGQHGIDGLAIVFDDKDQIKTIVITEDKCSHRPRNVITTQIWPEFEAFEEGKFDNKMVSRISTMLNHIDEDTALEMVNKDIFRYEIRRYRIGITPLAEHTGIAGRGILFKDYDEKVKGVDVSRRHAATLETPDIRKWMEKFSEKVIAVLNSKRTSHV
jgi:hypothetical protein